MGEANDRLKRRWYDVEKEKIINSLRIHPLSRVSFVMDHLTCNPNIKQSHLLTLQLAQTVLNQGITNWIGLAKLCERANRVLTFCKERQEPEPKQEVIKETNPLKQAA